MNIDSFEKIKTAKRWVIKIGSSSLTKENKDGICINKKTIERVAEQINILRKNNIQVALVTSGAVAMGSQIINSRPVDLHEKQACAAIGQSKLMSTYHHIFSKYNIRVSQILLTQSDMENEVGYINARNSINCLLDWDVLPIINENDCVATEEISLGDNDNLASWVVDLMQCKLMVFLTDVDGLYDCNPFKNKKANLLKLVDLSTKEVDGISTEFFSQIGTGGMATKILAAKKAAKCGASTVILNAKEDITKLCSDSDTKGSLLFLPSKK